MGAQSIVKNFSAILLPTQLSPDLPNQEFAFEKETDMQVSRFEHMEFRCGRLPVSYCSKQELISLAPLGQINHYHMCWKWCCSPSSHDTSFVQIASGRALICGFGYELRIRAYGFGLGRLVCTFGKALGMQECAIVLGSCCLRESRERKARRQAGRKAEELWGQCER